MKNHSCYSDCHPNNCMLFSNYTQYMFKTEYFEKTSFYNNVKLM